MTINELKITVAEMIEEAKKKNLKEKEFHKKGRQIEAFGTYDSALDFSAPLGGYNLYGSQGAVNWGPFTGPGPHIDQNFANPNTANAIRETDEIRALRVVVREVLEHGLVPAESAWSPLMERKSPASFDSPWEAAMNEANHWYMQHCETNGVPEAGPRKKTEIENTKYGKIVKHGPPESKGGARKKAW